MKFNVVTLFPEMIEAALKVGVVGQAVTKNIIEVKTVNPRQFTSDIHHTVDDRPYGGGDGMVMLVEPLKKSLEFLGEENLGHRVYLSAQGKPWRDSMARKFAQTHQTVTLVCGRYGGIDQRFINSFVDEEISIGDYVLSGGELAALVIIDSMARFHEQVLGNSKSAQNESFADGLLESPLFTRPQGTEDNKVPDIFLSGDHAKVEKVRRALSLLVTFEKRPDLLSEVHQIEMGKARKLLGEFSVKDLKACGLSEKSLNFLDKR